MQRTPLSPNLVQLTQRRAVNAYLVRDGDGLILVDAMLRGAAEELVAAAAAERAPIVRILVTHAHPPRVGSLDALARLLPDAEIGISLRDDRILRGDRTLDPGEPDAPLRIPPMCVDTLPGRVLTPGERVGPLEVVPAPGHTPGHVAFLDVRDRTLLAGDAFTTFGGISVSSRVNPWFPFTGLATWHRPTALRSAHELRRLEPRLLACGHGRALRYPAALMDRALAKADRALARRR